MIIKYHSKNLNPVWKPYAGKQENLIVKSTGSTILATCVGRMLMQYPRCEIKFILVMDKLIHLHDILNIITVHF